MRQATPELAIASHTGRIYDVLVAEHDDAVRRRVCSVLRGAARFGVAAEELTAVGAVASAVHLSPDLCLIDREIPGGGASAAWEIAARLPETKIVFLGSAHDPGLLLALAAGASGLVSRDAGLERLPHVLTRVIEGEVTVPREAVAQLVLELRDRRARRRPTLGRIGGARLTSREWEVLDLLCSGAGTAEIARMLDISPATVRSHTARALRKLGLPNRESAIRTLGRRR
jgi:DNA-binding NarL/FixJ family response regulator